MPEASRLNFQQASVEVQQPNGGTAKYPAYHLTRDGFTLLAMGFTGKRALAFKLAYIDAFNKMEAALTGKTESAPAQPHPLKQQELDMNSALNDAGLSPAVVNEIVTSTTQGILETLQKKRLLVNWPEVTEAIQNPKTEMTFSDLTSLTQACLARLQRNINAEAYDAIARRAANQGVSTSQVSLHA